MPDIKKYTKNDGVTFLLENGETVFLKTNYTGIGSESFSNGYYFRTSFIISNDDIIRLKRYKITDVRISFLGEHFDKEINEKTRFNSKNVALI